MSAIEDYERAIEENAAQHGHLVQLWMHGHKSMAQTAVKVLRDGGFQIPPARTPRDYLALYRLGRFLVGRRERGGHKSEVQISMALAMLHILGRFHRRVSSFHGLDEVDAISLFVIAEGIGGYWAIFVGHLNGSYVAPEALDLAKQRWDSTYGRSMEALNLGNRTRIRRKQSWENALRPFALKQLALNPRPPDAAIVARFRNAHPEVWLPASDGPSRFVGKLRK